MSGVKRRPPGGRFISVNRMSSLPWPVVDVGDVARCQSRTFVLERQLNVPGHYRTRHETVVSTLSILAVCWCHHIAMRLAVVTAGDAVTFLK